MEYQEERKMKKKVLSLLLAMTMSVALLCGCTQSNDAQKTADDANESTQEIVEDETVSEADSAEVSEDTVADSTVDDVTIHVASLKGPTSIGLVKLWQDAKDNTADAGYEFNMYTAADEILPLVMKGDVDIALVPANVAANLYQKSGASISVIDINTLGVLYMVSGDNRVDSVEALAGKTVYLT